MIGDMNRTREIMPDLMMFGLASYVHDVPLCQCASAGCKSRLDEPLARCDAF